MFWLSKDDTHLEIYIISQRTGFVTQNISKIFCILLMIEGSWRIM